MVVYVVTTSYGAVCGFGDYQRYEDAYKEALFWLGSDEECKGMEIYEIDRDAGVTKRVAAFGICAENSEDN